MDPNAPPNMANKPSLPHEADDPSLFGEADDLALTREADQTTLGDWLEGFFHRPSSPSSIDPRPTTYDPAVVFTPYPVPHTPYPAVAVRHPLHRKIRRVLRNYLSEADLARIVATIFLLLAGTALIVATAMRYVTHISPTGAVRAPWQIPLLLAANALMWILSLTVPSLVMIKLILDLPWFRVALYFSAIWFLAGLALFL